MDLIGSSHTNGCRPPLRARLQKAEQQDWLGLISEPKEEVRTARLGDHKARRRPQGDSGATPAEDDDPISVTHPFILAIAIAFRVLQDSSRATPDASVVLQD